MKKNIDKKALYEKIMSAIVPEVKKAIDEDWRQWLKNNPSGFDHHDPEQTMEDDFDNLVDEILSRSKDSAGSSNPEPIIPREGKGFVYLSTSPDTCPVCGNSLSDDYYCVNCNIKFSFVVEDGKNH